MLNYQSLIQEFNDIVKNPRATITQQSRSFKGTIGIMPPFCPEEIFYAAGYLPVGLWGGSVAIAKARTYLPPFACSLMQSVMELELNGSYDDLSAVVFSTPCDTLKCMSQKWHRKAPFFVFTHPQNRQIEASNLYFVQELENMIVRFEEAMKIKIEMSKVSEAIQIYNENRKVMRDFVKVANIYPQIITPRVRHHVIKARYFMDKVEHTQKVRSLIAALNLLPVQPFDGKKLVLTGVIAEPDIILDILQEQKFTVVADNLMQESLQFNHDVPEGKSPLYRLSKWWQLLEGCSLATDPQKLRGKILIDLVKEHQADAVLACLMKFCEPEEFDFPVFIQQLDNENIRNIVIEIDQETTSFEQIRTRIQTFGEIL